MKNSVVKSLATVLATLTVSVTFSRAAVLVVDGGYSATASTNPAYADTGGVELTDGVTDTPVWPDAAVIGPLTGWQNIDATATFNFNSVVNVTQLTVWAADSDGNAGVGLPESIRVISGGFDQVFPVTNPAGSGTMIPITIGGLNLNTTSVQLDIARDTALDNPFCCGGTYEWTMVSEVQFEGSVIPEPSTGLLLGLGPIGLIARRRRRA